MKKRILISLSLCVILTIYFSSSAFACTTVIAGKKATKDGSIMIARNEDSQAAWAKRFIVHPRTANKPGSYYKSTDNKFEYPLPEAGFKYTATPDWDPSQGIFEEAGINEYQVAVSATETVDSNEKASKADPFNKDKGITESSIPTILLPRIKTAREGVILMGNIIESIGAGEPFGMAIGDVNEAWYLECGSGHRWIAVRIPDDSYMVAANQLRIGEVNLNDTKNFIGSKDLISFAEKNGLYNKNSGAFNFARAYGTDTKDDYKTNYPRIWWGEKMLTPSLIQKQGLNNYPLLLKPDKKLTPIDIMSVLRSHYDGTEFDPDKSPSDPSMKLRAINVNTTMESHILQLRGWLPNPIGGVQWLAMGVPESSAYVRFYSGINDTPSEYKKGTDKYDSTSAYWAFRSVGALVNTHYSSYSYVLNGFREFENKELSEQDSIDSNALKLYKQDQKKCDEYLTTYSNNLAASAVKIAKDIISQLITNLTSENKSN